MSSKVLYFIDDACHLITLITIVIHVVDLYNNPFLQKIYPFTKAPIARAPLFILFNATLINWYYDTTYHWAETLQFVAVATLLVWLYFSNRNFTAKQIEYYKQQFHDQRTYQLSSKEKGQAK